MSRHRIHRGQCDAAQPEKHLVEIPQRIVGKSPQIAPDRLHILANKRSGHDPVVGGKIGANGAMTITGNAEIIDITGDVDGNVSLGTIVEGGRITIGVFTDPPERVVLVKSDLKGTLTIATKQFGKITQAFDYALRF